MIVLVQMSIIVKTIINYHAVLDVFKFDMKADVSFYRSNKRMKVHDSFSASSFAESRLKPRTAIVVVPLAKSACNKFAITVAITALLSLYRAIFVKI